MAKHRNGPVKRYNVEKNHKGFGETVNYDFEEQMQPKKRMGDESFANMPSEPMIKNFSRSHNMRSGVINDFSCGLEEDSGIEENKNYEAKKEYT